MKRNKGNNQPDHPKGYYYFNVSYLRKCLLGNTWRCNNLILNIMKTKQITGYIVETENMSRDRCSPRRFVLGRWKVFVLLRSDPEKMAFPEAGCRDMEIAGLLEKSSFSLVFWHCSSCGWCALRPEGWWIMKVVLNSVVFAPASAEFLVELKLSFSYKFSSV